MWMWIWPIRSWDFKRIMTTDTTELMAGAAHETDRAAGNRIVEPGAVTDSFLLRAELVNWRSQSGGIQIEDYSGNL